MKKKYKAPIGLQVIQKMFPIIENTVPILAKRLAVHLFFKPMRFSVPEREKEYRKVADKFKINVSDRSIQCYAWGSGPTILFIHGWSGRATQFYKFIGPFNESGYRVLTFDGPAHGISDGKKTNILEFREVIQTINDKYGDFPTIITHSFGGAALLYAIQQGLNVRNVINISSPTDGNKIINEFLKRINGSPKIAKHFNTYVSGKFGKTFNEFSSLYVAKNIPKINLMLIHDEDDREVGLEQATMLNKIIDQSSLHITQGLGHSRILRDEVIVKKCLNFVEEAANDKKVKA